MGDAIYLPSDLAGAKRTEFLNQARHGVARLRATDGTSLVMLPESRLELLESLAKWAEAYVKLESFLRRSESPPTVADLGDLAWLRRFDREDQKEFLEELHDALIAARSDGDLAPLESCLHAWQVTSRELEDPLRERVLTGEHHSTDFVEVTRPESDAE